MKNVGGMKCYATGGELGVNFKLDFDGDGNLSV
jgi:hypothetical protein